LSGEIKQLHQDAFFHHLVSRLDQFASSAAFGTRLPGIAYFHPHFSLALRADYFLAIGLCLLHPAIRPQIVIHYSRNRIGNHHAALAREVFDNFRRFRGYRLRFRQHQHAVFFVKPKLFAQTFRVDHLKIQSGMAKQVFKTVLRPLPRHSPGIDNSSVVRGIGP